MSPYQQAIVEATAANGKDAGYIEDIMRNDIFHSTLDWQSRAQLVRGAREAVKMLKIYRADPSLAKYFPEV
ncbi:MAG: hypothetical protein UY62_C0036G0008 [Parcubacteria group bacterium GW2011_GWF2_50_9]|nr:MAG: hypothetical protein UY62_C0036G0008 [Parcubacteria group bacterium GW2011_GWF2_50_9]